MAWILFRLDRAGKAPFEPQPRITAVFGELSTSVSLSSSSIEKAADQAVLAFQGLLDSKEVEFSPHPSRSRAVSVRDLQPCKHGDELSTSSRYLHLWTPSPDWFWSAAVGTIAIVAGSGSRGRWADAATGEKEVLVSQGSSSASPSYRESSASSELTSQVRRHTETVLGPVALT